MRKKTTGPGRPRKYSDDKPPARERRSSYDRPKPESTDRPSPSREERPWKKRTDSTPSGDKPVKSFRKEGPSTKRFSKDEERPRPERKSGEFGDKPARRYAKPDSGFSKDERRPRPERKSGEFGDKPARRYAKPEGSFSPEKRVRKRLEKGRKPSTGTSAESGLIRLNRYISNSGVCSRREADNLIAMGLISVNGTIITEMGFKVKPGDEVRHEDKVLRAEKPVYILLNKPKGYITTTKDPEERKTVMSLIAKDVKERVYPVGRLDRNTTGLLLLTNDGELADMLTHPSYNIKKIYKVDLDRGLTQNDFQKILDGVYLEEGRAQVDDLALITPDGKTVGIELHIGWNRIVRRIFEALGYQVLKLDRTVYAGLDKKKLPRGEWRFLDPEEVRTLKYFNKK